MFHTMLKWFYRILAPGHPRGWLDFHAVYDEPDAPTRWVHCHGMERWKLPNLEIVDVPADLIGYAHGIIFEVVGYMKGEKPIQVDESFGGAWVGGDDQPVLHTATMRNAPDRDNHNGLLRIVDHEEPVESGFPRRLFAAHMCALAFQMRNPFAQEEVFRRVIEMWPGEPAAGNEEFKRGDNPHNFVAWNGLGDALCDQGKFDEGLSALKEAVARCPGWAEDFAKHVRETVPAEALEDDSGDPRFRFWTELKTVGGAAQPAS